MITEYPMEDNRRYLHPSGEWLPLGHYLAPEEVAELEAEEELEHPANRPLSQDVLDMLYSAALDYYEDDSQASEALPGLIRRYKHHLSLSGATCDSCHRRKPLDAFSRDATRPDALRRICRRCATTQRALERERQRTRTAE